MTFQNIFFYILQSPLQKKVDERH